ncbi:MAG: pyridoxal 5'-phosphate synthase glutaminase subunit PdxT [Methylocystaceae bacterium]
MTGKKIGCLSLQGAFLEHQQMLERLGCETVRTRSKEDLLKIDGLIIPGGESTTIGKLLLEFGLSDTLLELAQAGMPIFGTCAGMIMLAKEIEGTDQYRLGLMDIKVRRNAFGRQVASFEADLEVEGIDHAVRGVFIRAPLVTDIWGEARVLSRFEDQMVMVRQHNLLAASFHPELTDDISVHDYFLKMIG